MASLHGVGCASYSSEARRSSASLSKGWAFGSGGAIWGKHSAFGQAHQRGAQVIGVKVGDGDA